MPSPSVMLDRVLIATAIVATAVLFTAQLADPVNIIKLTALVLCAIALVVSAAVRVVRHREARLPWGLPAAVGLALLIAFVVAALQAPTPSTAVLGAYGRNSGLLAYGSALVLFFAGLRVLDRDGTRVVLYALMLAGMFTASYGLLQYAGYDSVPWNNPFNPIIAALGNPNFAAAYVAICTPAAAWGALRTGWPTGMRVASAVLTAACLLTALLSDAAQGPLAAGPGLAVLALAWLLDRDRGLRRAGIAVLAVLTAAGAALLVAGIAGAGPAAGVFRDVGSRARGYYWEAALTLWRENPLLGVGLDSYGSFWRTARSVEAAQGLGGDNFSDAAHSVPLHLLATGGLLLGLAYAAFVALVAYALVIGLRRLRGEERLLVGALGGCWTAYQVQSLVSIDQVPLIVTQFALAAGVVVAAGRSRLRDVTLPGALPPPPPTDGMSRRQKQAAALAPKVRPVTAPDYVAFGLLGLAGLTLAWLSLAPLRASAAVLDGDAALAAGDGRQAVALFDRATDLVPGSPVYLQRIGGTHAQSGDPAEALEAYERALEADPFDVNSAIQGAGVAEQAGEIDRARELQQRAVELDPYGPGTVVGAARFELRHGGAERARALLEDLVAILPDRADAWASLGDARAVLGDEAAAREAYERALELQADEPTATQGLAQLQAEAA